MNIFEPTPGQLAEYEKWIAARPPAVAAVARRFQPWKLYRLPSGHRVTVYSFGEKPDGTVTLTVTVSGDFNLVTFERNVFGVNPDNLTECDLPAAGERLGALFNVAGWPTGPKQNEVN